MIGRKIRIALSSMAVCVLSACASAAALNSVSVDETLRAQAQARLAASEASFAVGQVTLAPGVDGTPQCRGLGIIDPTRGLTMPIFVRDAIQRDLTQAGRFAENADTVIAAEITEIRMVSMDNARWTLSMRVSSNHATGYTVTTTTPFPHMFVANDACQAADNAFPAAFRALLDSVYSHPEFATLSPQR